jgi:hypothetical protein
MAEEENLPEEAPQHRWRLPRPQLTRRSVLPWAVSIALTVLVLVVFSRMVLEPLFFSSEPEKESSRPVFPSDSDWPADVPVTPHTVPAIIKNELDTRGEQHGYEFEGTAGQVWRITIDPLDTSALDPIITLYGPSGEELASSDDRSAEDIGSELRVALPETGIYRLLVQSSLGGITTGGYWMEVWVE